MAWISNCVFCVKIGLSLNNLALLDFLKLHKSLYNWHTFKPTTHHNMKLPLALLSLCFISACSISSSKEIKQAEKLLQSFNCQNIEHDQADHSSMTSYHEQVLASSKQKAKSYVESYQHGDQIFDLPLPEVIETQLQSYTAACQSLGGVLPNPQQSL